MSPHRLTKRTVLLALAALLLRLLVVGSLIGL
jgi:hypothetical protein